MSTWLREQGEEGILGDRGMQILLDAHDDLPISEIGLHLQGNFMQKFQTLQMM